MSWASSEVVSVLVFLLPGFVAAAVFYSLTSYPKPNEFGQVIQALVFTMVGHSIAWTFRQILGSSISWSIGLEAVVSVLSAVIFALGVASISNNDFAHKLLRRIGFTRENSYSSEWYSSFAQNPDSYVVIHFRDGRRLYGWPVEWPSRPQQGHFRVVEGEWLNQGEDARHDETEAEIHETVFSVEDVTMVEFIKGEKVAED